MTKTISDLTEDLVAEILSRVPLTSLGSVRSTCKQWNALSRQRIFGEVAKAKNQILGFMMKDYKLWSVRIDFQGIHNDGDDFIDLSIKHVSVLDQLHVFKIYHYDGLLLCCLAGSLLIWNPYLGQERWIQHIFDSVVDSFVLGYDNNRNHKILQIFDSYEHRHYASGFKIYEFSSNSWRVLDVIPKWGIPRYTHGVTLKGNAYFYALERITMEGGITKWKEFLVCFDFTSERFGPRLSLPFQSSSDGGLVTLSCVKNMKLAVLYQDSKTPTILKIWVTNKIDYNEVLWTKWMELEMNLLTDFPRYFFRGSFSIDEENKVVVALSIPHNLRCLDPAVLVIGQDGYFKSIDVGGPPSRVKRDIVGYFPSLVQIE